MRDVLRGLATVVVQLTLEVLVGYRFGFIGWIVWALAIWLVIGVVAAGILSIGTWMGR